MDWFTTLFVAVGLALDAMTVSLGVGTSRECEPLRSKLRMAFSFGLFQCLMPLLGWAAGKSVHQYISQFDHWIAVILLAYVGVNMIRSGLHPGQAAHFNDPTRGKSLIILSVATSIDALAVGLSLAMLEVPVLTPALVIGVVTFGLSLAGLFAGHLLGCKFGQRMEIVGGLILNGIGLRVLITHL
jgi:putative Mn2+ efflux pump MntP